ncbi:YecR family lipoprotein [Escherichia coli]
MRLLILTLSLITLAGCTVTRQAHVSEVDAATGIVRLVYDQAFLQHAHTDRYVSRGIADRACQQEGYTHAVPFGQPVGNCSLFAGSLCLNTGQPLQRHNTIGINSRRVGGIHLP